MIAGTRPRLLQGAAASISWQPRGSDGEPTTVDPGTVTVHVVRADGTDVIAAGTATNGSTTSARTVALTAAQTADLDRLTAFWSVAATVVGTTSVDIVGDFYFASADLRAGEPSTSDPSRDTTAKVLSARAEIETLIEQVTSMAFVPRFDTHRTYTNTGVVVLPHPYLRRVRWARVWNAQFDIAPTYTDLVVSDVTANDEGIISIPYAGMTVEAGYEHGLDACPYDLRRAVLTAARGQVNLARSGVPDRATTMQLPDGGSVTLATPGVGRWHTGIPIVDEAINRYNVSTPSIA